MMSKKLQALAATILLLCSSASYAEQLIMTRAKQTFPEAMLKLQDVINNAGYTLSRVQRIDIGLTKSGYATDKYRIVFLGKNKNIKMISEKYPHLVPYVPWKIIIFAEQQETLLISANPMNFSHKKYPGADRYLKTLKKDIERIFTNVSKTE